MELDGRFAIVMDRVYQTPDLEITELGAGGYLCQASPISPYNEFNLGNDEF